MNNERDFDLTGIASSFGVITNEHDPKIVTEELGLSPTRIRQKGDETYSKYSSGPFIAQYGLWVISMNTVGEEICFAEHVAYYKELLSEKIDSIEKLTNHYKFECVLYVLTTTGDTVGGLELSEDDLAFIGKISNRFTYRFSSNLPPDDME